jgi:hypothetical protein
MQGQDGIIIETRDDTDFRMSPLEELATFGEFMTCRDTATAPATAERHSAAPPPNTRLQHADDEKHNVAVEEICTCIDFLICQDPGSYEFDLDQELPDNPDVLNTNTPSKGNQRLPDPPPSDPPATRNVLVQRVYAASCADSSSDKWSASNVLLESLHGIPLSTQQPCMDTDYEPTVTRQGDIRSSVATSTTSSRMRKRPEEYEPLIMIVDENDDEDDDDNVVNKTSSIRGVRDSSSTSSLQYQRHVPMVLSYASPQQQEPMVGHRNQYRHHLHRKFLKRRDILTTEPHHHSTFTNPRKHFSYDPDHERGNRNKNKDKVIHPRDDGAESSARRNITATSYHQLCSRRNQYTEQKEHRDEWMMMDTDTVGAVAPNSTVSDETRNDDGWMMQQHDVEPILPPPTNQVIMFPRRFVLDT